MPPPIRATYPTGFQHLQWQQTDDGSRTLVDTRLNESFHSGCGAVAETLIVYLFNAGVAHRLRSRNPTAVLEYGLGTATGFLLSAAMAAYYHTPLRYTAIEQALLPGSLFRELDLANAVAGCLRGGHARTVQADPQFSLAEFSSLEQVVHEFCDALDALKHSDVEGWQHLEFSWGQLQLFAGDALQCRWPAGQDAPIFDAIYYDPFSPESNPQLWSLSMFEQAAGMLRSGGKLTSYCVKGSVRRLAQQAGLQVHREPGPVGGKREVLICGKS